MISDEHQARVRAAAALGCDDATLELEPFADGWSVRLASGAGRRGLGPVIVEAATGAVLLFPSSLSRRQVVERFVELRPQGRQLDR